MILLGYSDDTISPVIPALNAGPLSDGVIQVADAGTHSPVIKVAETGIQ